MTAPDKIYVPITEGQEVAVNDWSGLPMAQYDYKKVVDNICYIRKDALVEWAKGQREKAKIAAGGCLNMQASGKFLAYDELIEKLNTM